MKDPIIVWIVDDRKESARDASEVVEVTASKFRADADPVILWADTFKWPPFASLRACVDPNTPPAYRNEYPNIVILDLFNDTSNGFKLEGDAFYYALRKWEMSKPDGPSFVVLWSPYQGEKSARQFIRSVEKNDQRLIPLWTKSPSMLATRLAGLWKRIVEEGDAR